MGFGTALESMDGAPELALAMVSGAGVVGFVYAERHEMREVIASSALLFVVGLWYWAVDRGGTLGGVLALF